MKVLICTDGSPTATTAILSAARFLRTENCELDLLCVAPPFSLSAGGYGQRRKAYEERIVKETNRILAQASETLRQAGAPSRQISEIGPPAETIIDRGAEYDLTVIGAKGRDVRWEVGLGPVATRVVEHAATPVLVGRDLSSDRGFRILAPVDGSHASRRALEVASELLNLPGAEITLIHVVETPWIHLGLEDEWMDAYEVEEAANQPDTQFERELTREAENVIEQARDLLSPTGAAIQTAIERGNPGNEILSAAERGEHDLILLGATGSSDLKHRLLGSVTSKIAWNAPCSVLVVRTAWPGAL
jgi:nucleotide-binding universal stress UspA family protein